MSEPDSDIDKALTALRLLRDTCAAAIDALQQPLSVTQASLLPSRPTCPVLYKDYQSLLTLIYTSTTKVTLVLRPSAPAPTAALAPIKDLSTSITSLATCASLFDLHGATLASEARTLARDVFDAVRALADMFLENAGNEYLVRTGTVHDVIEKARRDLPESNLVAVKRRWKADRGMLEDSLEDINSMVEGAGQEDEDSFEGEEFDEDLDDLGFGTSKKMSEIEMERTKKVQPLVRFATLLHKRVVPDVLGSVPNPEGISDSLNTILDTLPPLSHSLVLSIEEVVASLYAPQKPAALAASVAALVKATHNLHASITDETLLPRAQVDLAKDMSTLSIAGANAGEKKAKDPRKWFDSCLMQIDKAARAVDDMVTDQPANAT